MFKRIKLEKKSLTVISVVLGVALLATSVYADVVNRSAYEQFKDVVKSTSAQMSGQVRNYTLQTTFSLKDNDTLLIRTNSVQKVDGQRSETIETTDTGKGAYQSSYSYNDERQNIWYDRYADTYYVTEYNRSEYDADYIYDYGSYDPLAQDYVSDVERIVDAFIGNLKNHVTADLKDDGSRIFTGSLSDTEIPALVNAVASFVTKQYLLSSGVYFSQPAEIIVDAELADEAIATRYDSIYDDTRIPIPSLDGDVYIKSMNGRAAATPDDLITDVSVRVVLSGRDPDGNLHDLTFDISMTLTAVKTTSVTQPDLTGKNVQFHSAYDDFSSERISEKYKGTYRNDIIIEKDHSFVKIGERTLVIESVSDQAVVGSYSETYNEDQEGREPLSFEFTADNSDPYSLSFTYAGRNGQIMNGYLHFDPVSASIQFYDESERGNGWFNPTFTRVFD